MTETENALPRPPRAVLFDMDGVLIDSFEAWVAVMDECRARRGMAALGPGPIRASWGQGLLADCRTFFPGETPSVLAREYDDGFVRHVDKVVPEPGVGATLRALKAHGLATCLVTNSPLGMSRTILDRLGVLDAFDALATGDQVARGKPAPDIVHLAMERLGAAPGEAVLVGDTTLDLEAGRAARIPVVGFRIPGGNARVDALPDLLPLFGLPALAEPYS